MFQTKHYTLKASLHEFPRSCWEIPGPHRSITWSLASHLVLFKSLLILCFFTPFLSISMFIFLFWYLACFKSQSCQSIKIVFRFPEHFLPPYYSKVSLNGFNLVFPSFHFVVTVVSCARFCSNPSTHSNRFCYFTVCGNLQLQLLQCFSSSIKFEIWSFSPNFFF